MKEQRKLNEARVALGRLRSLDHIHQFLLNPIVDAQADGWTLDEIGTNQEELRAIANGYLMKEAGEALGRLRMITTNYSVPLGIIRGALAKCGLTVEALGTSEDELRQLAELHRQRDEQRKRTAAAQ